MILPALFLCAACASTSTGPSPAKLSETLPQTAWSEIVSGARPLETGETPPLDLSNPRDLALCTLAVGVAREGGGADDTDYWEDRLMTSVNDAGAGLTLMQDTAAEYATVARAASERPDGLRYIMLLNTVATECATEAGRPAPGASTPAS